VISVYPAIAPLPTNAAAEKGGNLEQLAQLVELQQQTNALLNAISLQLALISGQSVSVGDCLDGSVLGSIQ